MKVRFLHSFIHLLNWTKETHEANVTCVFNQFKRNSNQFILIRIVFYVQVWILFPSIRIYLATTIWAVIVENGERETEVCGKMFFYSFAHSNSSFKSFGLQKNGRGICSVWSGGDVRISSWIGVWISGHKRCGEFRVCNAASGQWCSYNWSADEHIGLWLGANTGDNHENESDLLSKYLKKISPIFDSNSWWTGLIWYILLLTNSFQMI